MFKVTPILLIILVSCGFSCGQAHATEAQAALVGSTVESQYGDLSELTAEEKEWFVKFQEGNFLVDGWQKISADILAKTPERQREKQKFILRLLGRKIGLEWCKDNNSRKVDNAMLKDWGGTLKNAAKENPEDISKAIASINKTLDTLLD